jgi:hypothetical protein
VANDQMSPDQKRIWFDRGADALGRAIPEIPRGYGCPLCLRAFPLSRVADLTIEHIPPRSLGGRPMLLTCIECNIRGGGPDGVDTHARHAEHVYDFALGTLKTPRQAKLTIGDTTQNIRVTSLASLQMIGVPKADPPGTSNRMEVALMRRQTPDEALKFRIELFNDAFSARKQAISWLRSAYLAAFSALGYRYILRSILDDVRRQIRDADTKLIDDFKLFSGNADPTTRWIALTHEPDWVRGLLVQMGRHTALLPYFTDDSEFYDRLTHHRAQSHELLLETRPIAAWPSRPVLACD